MHWLMMHKIPRCWLTFLCCNGEPGVSYTSVIFDIYQDVCHDSAGCVFLSCRPSAVHWPEFNKVTVRGSTHQYWNDEIDSGGICLRHECCTFIEGFQEEGRA